MYETMRLFASRRCLVVARLVLCAVCSAPLPLEAQELQSRAKLPLELATALIVSRGAWVDETPFDACSIYLHLDRREAMPSEFPIGLRAMLGTADSLRATCGVVRPSPESRVRVYHRMVRVDSITVADAMATVYSTVMRGENIHREEARAVKHSDGGWGIISFSISGMFRLH